MSEYSLYDASTAPANSRQILDAVSEEFGMVPNLEKVLAASPPVLQAYTSLWKLFGQTSLSSIEQQVVYQTVNLQHQCNY